MLRRFAAASAGGALALMSYSVMVAAPASAQPELFNKVEVTKVVVGDSKGTGFQVVVTCVAEPLGIAAASDGFTHTETLTFGPQGGIDTAKAPLNSTCTIVETHDGGASKVDVSPSTCDFTVKPAPKDEATRILPQTCEVTVTNKFVPDNDNVVGPAGPQGPPGPPGESAVAAAATAVVSTARFTG
jgi:hypothetical protein